MGKPGITVTEQINHSDYLNMNGIEGGADFLGERM